MTREYTIRSLTLHVPPRLASRVLGEPEPLLARLQDAMEKAIDATNLRVETTRVVVQLADPAALPVEPERLGELAESYDVLLSVGSFPLDMAVDRWDTLLSLAENGLFFSVLLQDATWESARKASRLFHEAAERDPSLPTRFGVNVFGKPVVTPFFPLASSPSDHMGMTVSLTYPNYLLYEYRSAGYRGLVSAIVSASSRALDGLQAASRDLGVRPLGIDLSVAPWMAESSLGLVEYVAGVRMPEPGFLSGVYTVNRAIAEAAKNVGRALGFNELQLPVAEDLKMKKRVAELETTARDLARFSCACLAGLDLAVVPASIDDVAGLLLDVAACSRLKGRPLGVRIVPLSDVEPGDKVWLEKFGETPVMSI